MQHINLVYHNRWNMNQGRNCITSVAEHSPPPEFLPKLLSPSSEISNTGRQTLYRFFIPSAQNRFIVLMEKKTLGIEVRSRNRHLCAGNHVLEYLQPSWERSVCARVQFRGLCLFLHKEPNNNTTDTTIGIVDVRLQFVSSMISTYTKAATFRSPSQPELIDNSIHLLKLGNK
ncbi:unnamed protein product [Lactuca saligna]|uniref:Uncharacterized protein n=1 Tax=Lactuca saligna TaxID=75948 RepID=A0AA35Y0G3_LACSI|nr:unnamed protein product [Lactuca saligna]